MSSQGPYRFTLAQAVVIVLLLGLGFIFVQNELALLGLLVLMGLAAFLLNALFRVILRWAARQDDKPDP